MKIAVLRQEDKRWKLQS